MSPAARQSLRHSLRQDLLEAGCDEAGRGCLAGPVFAAAVILPPGFSEPLLDDSKRLTARQRDLLRATIEREALAWSVRSLPAAEVDRLNILNAALEAMRLAALDLRPAPQHLLIDGNRFKPMPEFPHTCAIKGDATFANVAAASVLAKTHRDEHMLALHQRWPHYGWDRNKGYPTAEHRLAILRHGPCPEHRATFRVSQPGRQLAWTAP